MDASPEIREESAGMGHVPRRTSSIISRTASSSFLKRRRRLSDRVLYYMSRERSMTGLARHVRKLKSRFLVLKVLASVVALLGIVFAVASIELCTIIQNDACEAKAHEEIFIKSTGTVLAVALSILVCMCNQCRYRILKHSETFNALNDNRAIDDSRLESYRRYLHVSTAIEVILSMIHPIPGFSKYVRVETMGHIETHSIDEILTIIMIVKLYHFCNLAMAYVQKRIIDDTAFSTGDLKAMKLSMKNSFSFTFRIAMRHHAIELITVVLVFVIFVSSYALRIAEGRWTNGASQYYWTNLWMSLSTLSTTGYGIFATSHLISAIIKAFEPSKWEDQLIEQLLCLKAKGRVVLICARIFQNKFRFAKGRISRIFFDYNRKQLRVQLASALLEMKEYKLEARARDGQSNGPRVEHFKSVVEMAHRALPAVDSHPNASEDGNVEDIEVKDQGAFAASLRLSEALKRLETSLSSVPTTTSALFSRATVTVGSPRKSKRATVRKAKMSPRLPVSSQDSVSAELGYVYEGSSFVPSHSLHL
ncbi:hypothetical protein GUITHDRAFT_100043 [Guillardia theta CCMP2712]|uniref:Potassium channel domain-containing protein n=1 Tax=Guillardia theta (strain CCMP2712) TaxID=905079 RepID=L1K1W1_GUITC|nr:hypothetical protein GUITHDRAFT_100043 [Guillardia theta CCMP2712]EKX54569.1 hypothetical protein GUITHDRAFT_100043 [Guillardia theta CCMP2712]|eukprot:XP_005841549.1 hypothetical protein GUITHDRAFT_100043 [Guillardia theta CCMP2712]